MISPAPPYFGFDIVRGLVARNVPARGFSNSGGNENVAIAKLYPVSAGFVQRRASKIIWCAMRHWPSSLANT